jgi:Alcohol dehydrogenase GroES-associated
MLGTILYGTRDVRCEEVPEPKILKPTDAIIPPIGVLHLRL